MRVGRRFTNLKYVLFITCAAKIYAAIRLFLTRTDIHFYLKSDMLVLIGLAFVPQSLMLIKGIKSVSLQSGTSFKSKGKKE